MAEKRIRVLLADDHPVFREGLSRILAKDEAIELIATADNGKEAVNLTQELCPDVVIMDIDMPLMTGIAAAEQIRCKSPQTAVLMLSAYNYDEYVVASVRAKVDGYLLKTSDPTELLHAVHMVFKGKSVFDTDASRELFYNVFSAEGKIADLRCGLHKRELEVLELVSRGMTNKEIGHKLSISEHTVGTHLANIFGKMGVESRTTAALYATEHHWFSMGDSRGGAKKKDS
ncbi:response regulator [Chloroflexota bacterium]